PACEDTNQRTCADRGPLDASRKDTCHAALGNQPTLDQASPEHLVQPVVPGIAVVEDDRRSAASTKHPPDLAQSTLDVGRVMQHAIRDNPVKALVAERKLFHVAL